MKCPRCTHPDTQVLDTRLVEDGAAVRRRRHCGSCEARFTTYERAELSPPAIVKKDGRRVDYQREKVHASMRLALRKRPVPVEAVDAALDRIEAALVALGVREAPAAKVGELVMQELQRLDQVAYVRFASVYRNFEHVEQFRALVDEARR